MFKPGTLVKLHSNYATYGYAGFYATGPKIYRDFWFDSCHVGLVIGPGYLVNNNSLDLEKSVRHIKILVGEELIVINRDALQPLIV